MGRIGSRVGSIPPSRKGMYGTGGSVGVQGTGVTLDSLQGRKGLEGHFDFVSSATDSLFASSRSFKASNLNLFFGARHMGEVDLLLGDESLAGLGLPGEGLRDSLL